jgi:hypothetical protein
VKEYTRKRKKMNKRYFYETEYKRKRKTITMVTVLAVIASIMLLIALIV